jgi:hypothetical protein
MNLTFRELHPETHNIHLSTSLIANCVPYRSRSEFRYALQATKLPL